ncbi:MAG: MBL fold metallo-hydrolase [Gemmatimonadetes bacterium]|nr:MBL fold metallo-hydrolase [Gemmatimonadota bacterium]
MGDYRSYTRREFLDRTTSCAAHMGIMAAASPLWARALWSRQERFPVVASESWGRLEQISAGIWALVSNPLEDRTTLCNGGIVAGRAGVVVIESFASDEGARWMAQQAMRLVGRPPTHVILTHHHGDHTGGLRGAAESTDVVMLATALTRDTILERNRNAPADVLEGVELLGGGGPTEIDLGDRSLLVVPRRGHTDSDVSIEIADPSVVFCGDLVWNGMFPNYVDAVPNQLSQNVRVLRRREPTTYVPGHGPLADDAAVGAYIELLDDVEAAARRAIERGLTAEQAGEEYRLPEGMEEWTLFSPGYFARAIGAWMTALNGV